MKEIENKKVLPIVKAALREDIGRGDITTGLLIPPGKKVRAVITAKEKGIVCGLSVAKLVFKTVDKRIRFHTHVAEGKRIKSGDILVHLEGNYGNILKAERTALNFLGRLSGIATQTDKFAGKIAPYKVKIMDTRKTTPNLRYLEKYAVRVGGGYNHRLGLYDQVLIKDNHIKIQNEKFKIQNLIKLARQKKPKGMKVEVEVRNLREFKQALLAKPNIIMLDNFSLKDIKEAVGMKYQIPNTKYQTPKLEVSGNVTLENIRKIAATGVDMISIGSLTHSASSLDITLKIYG